MTPASSIRCTKCQTELASEARFCTQCGTQVVQSLAADPKQMMIQNMLLAGMAVLLAVLVFQGA